MEGVPVRLLHHGIAGLSLLRQQEKNASHLKIKSWAQEVATWVSRKLNFPVIVPRADCPLILLTRAKHFHFSLPSFPQTPLFVAVRCLNALPESALQMKWLMDKRHEWGLSP